MFGGGCLFKSGHLLIFSGVGAYSYVGTYLNKYIINFYHLNQQCFSP